MLHEASASDQRLLAEWRWLTGGLPRLLAWSSGGDLFVSNPDGSVAMIDCGAGELAVVARSEAEFRTHMLDERQADEMLQRPVVEAFEAHHGQLAPDQCLGYTKLPILGGEYTVGNRFSLSIAEHASFTGDLHRQIRDLPDGSQVTLK